MDQYEIADAFIAPTLMDERVDRVEYDADNIVLVVFLSQGLSSEQTVNVMGMLISELGPDALSTDGLQIGFHYASDPLA